MEQKDTREDNMFSNGQSLTEQAEFAFREKHASMSVMIKKTDKIVTAIYMVTDFVSESEPIRPRLRSLSLSIHGSVRKIGARSSEPHYALADEVVRTIEETSSLIKLASTIGLVSEMNGQILVTELEKTSAEIKKLYGDKKVMVATHPGYANILLTPTMFDVPPEPVPIPEIHKGQEIFKGQIQTQKITNFPSQYQSHVPMRTESFAKKSDIGMKIARRNDVLNVVRSKGRVSIKDITSILKDISEKTVQRELLALVHEGVLVKEGEKRWSVYRLR